LQDEVFFVQNAGAAAAGTGLNKSNIIQKIALSQAAAVSSMRNASGHVQVQTVNATPPVINSNGLHPSPTNFPFRYLFECLTNRIIQERRYTVVNSSLPAKARATTQHLLCTSSIHYLPTTALVSARP
jgi:hypothetical protein